MENKSKRGVYFTHDRDLLLLDAVSKGFTWSTVSKAIGKSEKACRNRYNLLKERERATKKPPVATMRRSEPKSSGIETWVDELNMKVCEPAVTTTETVVAGRETEDLTPDAMPLEPTEGPVDEMHTDDEHAEKEKEQSPRQEEADWEIGELMSDSGSKPPSAVDTMTEAITAADDSESATAAPLTAREWREELKTVFQTTIDAVESVTIDETQGMQMFQGLAVILEKHIERLHALNKILGEKD